MTSMEFRKRTKIILWGAGISAVPLLFGFGAGSDIQTRGYSFLGEIVYFSPYLVVFLFGGILGWLTYKMHDDSGKSSDFGWPFRSLLVAVILFDGILAFWSARPDHFVQGRTYLADVFSQMMMLSLVALFQIVLPFIFGYSIMRFSRRSIEWLDSSMLSVKDSA